MLHGFWKLVLERQFHKSLIKHKIDDFILISMLSQPKWWMRQQSLIKVWYVISWPLELGDFILWLNVFDFYFSNVIWCKVMSVYKWIKYSLILQWLRCFSGLKNLSHYMILYSLKLCVQVEFLQTFAEVAHVILIIHFCEFLEYDQLINRTMNLFTSSIFKLLQSLTVLIGLNNELFQKVICSR